MAHGFGCTRDGGLAPFAERFAAAGCHVVTFDYRGFGTSDGEPRQRVSHRRQRQDYEAVVAAVRRMDDVDPDRVVVWGTSCRRCGSSPIGSVTAQVGFLTRILGRTSGSAP